MGPTVIAVIDNGICNLRSVTKALEAVGAVPKIVHSPGELDSSEAAGLVLPGVGALRDCVGALRAAGLDEAVKGWIRDDRPFLGVCLGMQALFDHSEEGDVTGLGVFAGRVRRFRLPEGLKIPHMGWNTLDFRTPESLIGAGLRPNGQAVYFVHSYYCEPEDPDLVVAHCDYGGPFPAIIGNNRTCFATQFHPEKSQSAGLQIYRNFKLIAEGNAPVERRFNLHVADE